MSISETVTEHRRADPSLVSTQLASPAEDLVTVVLGSWIVIGAATDGWAHLNINLQDDGFFTPWHALLYSGFAATAGWTVARVSASASGPPVVGRRLAGWVPARRPRYGDLSGGGRSRHGVA